MTRPDDFLMAFGIEWVTIVYPALPIVIFEFLRCKIKQNSAIIYHNLLQLQDKSRIRDINKTHNKYLNKLNQSSQKQPLICIYHLS